MARRQDRICARSARGSSRTNDGLSETSASLNDGGARQLCGLERVPVAPRGSRVALDVEEAGFHVRRERRHGQEERLTGCRRRLDEPLGLARVDVGLVVAVRVTPSVQLTGDHLLPAVHLAGLGRRTPPVEAGRLIRRSLAGGDPLVAVQVLADPAGAVAPLVQGDRGRRRVVERLDRALGRVIAQDFVVVRVLAGEVGGARRAAERERGERLGEARALAADPPAGRAQGAHVAGRLVVGHHHHDVARRDALRARRAPGRGRSRAGIAEPASASAARHARTCLSIRRPACIVPTAFGVNTPPLWRFRSPPDPAEKRGPEYRGAHLRRRYRLRSP